MTPERGRFSFFSPDEIVIAKLGIKEITVELAPRYNVAPEQDIGQLCGISSAIQRRIRRRGSGGRFERPISGS